VNVHDEWGQNAVLSFKVNSWLNGSHENQLYSFIRSEASWCGPPADSRAVHPASNLPACLATATAKPLDSVFASSCWLPVAPSKAHTDRAEVPKLLKRLDEGEALIVP